MRFALGAAQIVLAGLAVLLPARARAQSHEDVGRADALFNAGKALAEAGQYGDACPKFAESKRLAPGLGVTLYLADCYEHVGRTASAWTEFLSAEGLARERNDKRAEVARDRAQAIEPALARLTITVDPTVPKRELQVLRDGALVSLEELGLPIPVDPGDHVVVASLPGHKARVYQSHVGPERRTDTVHVDSFDEPPALEERPPPPARLEPVPISAPTTTTFPPIVTEPLAPPASAAGPRRWIGLGLGGAGVIGVAVGAVFALGAKSKLDQSNAGPCDATDHCDSAGLALRKDAAGSATASNIALALGGAALATGLVLYLTAPSPPSRSSVSVTATTGFVRGGAGAFVQASF